MADRAIKGKPLRERWDARLYESAQQMYNETPRPTFAKMERRLLKRFGDGPTARALQDWPKKGWLTEEAEDAPWQLGDLSPEDDAVVVAFIQDEVPGWLEYLSALDDDDREGLESPFVPTLGLARWIVKVRKAAPDLEDRAAVARLAHEFLRGGQDAVNAKMGLAFAPWRDEGAALRQAQALGLIEREALYLWDDKALWDDSVELLRTDPKAAARWESLLRSVDEEKEADDGEQ